MTSPAIGDGSFPAGTRIAIPSPDGVPTDIAVEALRQGDAVLTLSGPVRLRHSTAITSEPTATRRLLIRITAGALDGGLPRRDLLLPAEQMLYIRDPAIPEGALVPLGALVNATSIRREDQQTAQTWYRIELETQAVVLAEGLAVAARCDPTAPPFAEMLPPGPAIFALRRRLMQAAPEVDADPPTLRIVAHGMAVELLAGSTEADWQFRLPADFTQFSLVSPPGVPADTTANARADARRFGIAIRAISLDDEPLDLAGLASADGFHPLEQAGTQTWRWTTGNATLRLPPSRQPRRLTIAITDWHTLLHRV